MQKYKVNRKIVSLDIDLNLSLEEVQALKNALDHISYINCREHTHIEKELRSTLENALQEASPSL